MTAPAYLILDTEVIDPVAYVEYKKNAAPIVKKHGGEYLVRGGAFDTPEGNWPITRLVVIRYPSRAAADAMLNDPDYAPWRALRLRIAKCNMVVVEGVAEPV